MKKHFFILGLVLFLTNSPRLFGALKWTELGPAIFPGGYVVLKYDARELKCSEPGRRVLGVRSLVIAPQDPDWNDDKGQPLLYEFSSLNDRVPFGRIKLEIPAIPTLANRAIKFRVEAVFKSDIKGTRNSEVLETNRDILYVHVGLDRMGFFDSRNVSFLLLFLVVAMVLFQMREARLGPVPGV